MVRAYTPSCKLESKDCCRMCADRFGKSLALTLHRSWQAIVDEAQSLKSRNWIVRLLRSDEDAKKITELVGRLSSSMQNFTV